MQSNQFCMQNSYETHIVRQKLDEILIECYGNSIYTYIFAINSGFLFDRIDPFLE